MSCFRSGQMSTSFLFFVRRKFLINKKRKLRKVFVKFYLASIINLIAVLSSPSMAIS